MGKWSRKTHKLPQGHGFTARPGNNVFVAGRGAVQFEFPEQWIMIPKEGSVRFHDRQPPDDDMVLEMSYQHLPPLDWSTLPLTQLLHEVLKADEQAPEDTPMQTCQRGGMDVAWATFSFDDVNEHRPAVSLIGMARGLNVQVLFTGACWPDDEAVFTAVWQTVVETLQLGMGPPARTRN